MPSTHKAEAILFQDKVSFLHNLKRVREYTDIVKPVAAKAYQPNVSFETVFGFCVNILPTFLTDPKEVDSKGCAILWNEDVSSLNKIKVKFYRDP